jgi:hypothetical protein
MVKRTSRTTLDVEWRDESEKVDTVGREALLSAAMQFYILHDFYLVSGNLMVRGQALCRSLIMSPRLVCRCNMP